MKTTQGLGLTLLAALALTACASASTTGTPTTTTPPAAAATATSSTAAASSTTAAITSAASTSARVSTAETLARRGRCVSSALRASLGPSGAAAGTSYIALRLTNRGRVTCTLDGYPGVSFVAGTAGHQIGAPAQRDRRFGAAPVTLAPGATAHATVKVADYENYSRQVCQPARATGYRLYPPGSTGALFISAPQTVCSKPGVQTFQVTVVRSGTLRD